MKIGVNIEKKYAFVMIGLLVIGLGIVIVNAYGTSTPSTIGHSAGELDLSDGVNGDAVFNGNVEVNGGVNVSGDVIANSFIGTVTKECPSGFTSIEAVGNQLGCMQTSEANGGTGLDWRASNDYCFTNYGGKLPSLAEWYISMSNFDLNDEIDDYEWIDDGVDYRDLQKIIGGGSLSQQTWEWGYNTEVFRCWIPA